MHTPATFRDALPAWKNDRLGLPVDAGVRLGLSPDLRRLPGWKN